MCNEKKRLCGFPPFYEETNEKLFDMIKSGSFDFPSPQWDEVSDIGEFHWIFKVAEMKIFNFWLAKDLIKNLLIVDPSKRFTADQILKHPWVVGIVTPRTKLADVTKNIRELNARKRLKV